MLPRMTDARDNPGLIEVKVQTLHQLFNSMDPSPFHERDLDHDAEEFIVSWAQEHHRTTPLKLLVHLGQPPETGDAGRIVTESIHHYFEYKAALSSHELRRLMREGWISLLIGLAFLVSCVIAAKTIARYAGDWKDLTKEGLTILGWVAMWHPLEIYLYRWWPQWGLGRIYRKLSTMPVEVRLPA
jgi:hypothetical protein